MRKTRSVLSFFLAVITAIIHCKIALGYAVTAPIAFSEIAFHLCFSALFLSPFFFIIRFDVRSVNVEAQFCPYIFLFSSCKRRGGAVQ